MGRKSSKLLENVSEISIIGLFAILGALLEYSSYILLRPYPIVKKKLSTCYCFDRSMKNIPEDNTKTNLCF